MKLKRLLTAALSAVMALSVCALPAMAEGTLTNGTPVWGDTTIGSITIHKYEYNGKGNTATGADGETAPTDAKPLGGVTFEIYKVQNNAWLEKYYNGDKTIDISKLSADKYYTKDSSTGKITVNGTPTLTPEQTITTDDTTGVATASGLDLGLYLVVETKAPDKVTAPVDPFLVSVPMTRIADNGTTNKLTDWIFDVHVYPKNSTTYGEVTIEKKGYTGGSDGTLLQGVEFVLEKHTGAGNEASDWTVVNASEQDPTNTFDLVTDTNGQIKLSGLSQGEYRIYEDSYTAGSAAANKGYILDQTYHTFTVNPDGKITYGAITNPAITISVENDRPDMKKEVKNGTGWEDDAQYGVGDTVSYKITIEIPKNIDKLKTFTVTDTPTNLKDNTETIKVVKVKTAGEATDTPLEKGTDYTVVPDTTGGFKLTFNQSATVKGCAGRTVTITYDAVVMNSAVVGGNGNSNKATLEYTNKIKNDGTPDETIKNTIEDSAVMYSFGIKIVKTQEDNKTPLPGVMFDLYREAKAGETSVITGDDAKKVGLDKDKSWVCVKKGLTTDENGIIDTSDSSNTTNFTGGLANGDYYLVETKTAEGYNLLTKPVEVNLKVTATTTWTTSDTFDNTGKLVKRTVEKTVFTNANGDTAKPELTVTNIVNRAGFNLPTTGGFGTLLFSGIGVLLVLAGVSVLFSLKKKSKRA